jgi:hypothetical protein
MSLLVALRRRPEMTWQSLLVKKQRTQVSFGLSTESDPQRSFRASAMGGEQTLRPYALAASTLRLIDPRAVRRMPGLLTAAWPKLTPRSGEAFPYQLSRGLTARGGRHTWEAAWRSCWRRNRGIHNSKPSQFGKTDLAQLFGSSATVMLRVRTPCPALTGGAFLWSQPTLTLRRGTPIRHLLVFEQGATKSLLVAPEI